MSENKILAHFISLLEWSGVSEHQVLFQAWEKQKTWGRLKSLVSLCMFSNGLKIERGV
jgi:hypothetical protein